MSVTIAQMKAWNAAKRLAAQKKAQAARLAQVMAVMKKPTTPQQVGFI